MRYDHTQDGSLHLLVYLTAALVFASASICRGEPLPAIVLLLSGVAILPLGMCFHWLRVYDDGDQFRVRFGPLPVFGTRIRYDEITDVGAERSTFLDGWGVHWTPGKGWIFNLWGFDCVRVETRRRTVRIGTDDVVNLVAFLRNQMPRPEGP